MTDRDPLAPDLAAVRRAVFTALASTGAAPSAGVLATTLGRPLADVRRTLRALHEGHHLVLDRSGDAVRMAHPFSAAPMGFVLRATDDRLWWGGCAWDSFGIAAALGEQLEVTTRCAGCATTLTYATGPTTAPPDGLVVRLPRPAATWWDDVVDTCSRVRAACSEEHADDASRREGLPGATNVAATTMWRLAQGWYGDRLDPDYAPQTREERQRQLEAAGLVGRFWTLP